MFFNQKLDSCFYSELPKSARMWEVMHNWTTLIHVLHVSCSGSLKLNVKCVGEAVNQSKINCSTYTVVNRGIILGNVCFGDLLFCTALVTWD